ncbi:DUF4232 domain-containing protein [Streptomyces salyersiae]|uniref:DUF4232 domain-containing protein n=1 Tax=Streptomyces salyersiae TaxID=3075530 RepID=A0ABU2RJ39_9ACTN|nr:DUF4232 domain-containing protein [Streptomyces sp. DSM 41770]MDT0427484.1 DUF4232 domain-containing protein [Streptomyces sp. DSM 41770]
MRVKKMSALALAVAAAGLSLTACGGGAGSNAAADTSGSATASSSTGGQDSTADSGSSSASSTGSGKGSSPTSGKGSELAANSGSTTSGALCKTDDLTLSVSPTGVEDPDEKQIVVNLKNDGSGTCSMRGFPGVQLVGPDGLGDTGPDAARTDTSGDAVTIASGEETRFLLHYIPDTSGSGKTYTRLSVTPPDEKISAIVNLGDLAITVAAPSATSPDVFVDPIGYHVGSGK